jgi:hypothetical protein
MFICKLAGLLAIHMFTVEAYVEQNCVVLPRLVVVGSQALATIPDIPLCSMLGNSFCLRPVMGLPLFVGALHCSAFDFLFLLGSCWLLTLIALL